VSASIDAPPRRVPSASSDERRRSDAFGLWTEPPYDGWRRPAPSRGDLQRDLAGAVALCLAAVITTPLYGWSGWDRLLDAPLWVQLLWSAAVTLPIAWRRRWPNGVAVVVAAVFTAGGIAFGVSLFFPNIALFVSFYSVGAWSGNRQHAQLTRGLIFAAMIIWLIVAMFVYATTDDGSVEGAGPFSPLVSVLLIQVLTNVTFFAGAYYLGNRGWAQAVEQYYLQRQEAELAEARERATRQAVALDRIRIARELHDVVAHHVSVMGVQASAARVALDSDIEASRQALGRVEDSARTAITELRAMLGTLRGHDADDAESGATVGVTRLPELVRQIDDSGLPTRYEELGEPAPLPSVIDVNLYRIAQEALTNVRKHAGHLATADVRLRYLGDEVEIEISNSGTATARQRGSGMGQIGMRERAAASGGSIEFGPRHRGGYLVRARLPLRGNAT
jgi:signal transduction histidine kinase